MHEQAASRWATRPDGGPLGDPQGRVLDYLRLSVTDRCNLRCTYCAPGGHGRRAEAALLSIPELLRIGALFAGLGVRKIRLTGGEPLVRKGVCELAAGLRALPGVREVAITTNGLLLQDRIDTLWAAGVRRLNISLDSLDAETFRRVAGRGDPRTVLEAIDRALELGFEVKVNVVVMGGVNDHEIPAFVALTKDRPLFVRFIELMGFDGRGGRAQHIDARAIRETIARQHELVPVRADRATVARRFRIAGHAGDVGLIAGRSRVFCRSCSRLRVSATGEFRTCLYGRPAAQLGAMLRGGATDGDLEASIRGAVACRAPNGHAAEHAAGRGALLSMAKIGG